MKEKFPLESVTIVRSPFVPFPAISRSTVRAESPVSLLCRTESPLVSLKTVPLTEAVAVAVLVVGNGAGSALVCAIDDVRSSEGAFVPEKLNAGGKRLIVILTKQNQIVEVDHPVAIEIAIGEGSRLAVVL